MAPKHEERLDTLFARRTLLGLPIILRIAIPLHAIAVCYYTHYDTVQNIIDQQQQ